MVIARHRARITPGGCELHVKKKGDEGVNMQQDLSCIFRQQH